MHFIFDISCCIIWNSIPVRRFVYSNFPVWREVGLQHKFIILKKIYKKQQNNEVQQLKKILKNRTCKGTFTKDVCGFDGFPKRGRPLWMSPNDKIQKCKKITNQCSVQRKILPNLVILHFFFLNFCRFRALLRELKSHFSKTSGDSGRIVIRY